MKLDSPVESIKRLFDPKPVDWLVFEFNGFSLKAAKVTVEDGSLTAHEIVHSSKATVDACFSELVERLRDGDNKLPTQALLITSQAASSVLELPINPFAPYKESELTELVRWEFEQQLTEQLSSLTLDTIFVGRGLMTEPEVDETREAMLLANSGIRSVAAAPTKFADQAVGMGIVSRHDADESLKILEAFQTFDDNLSCKFFPIAKEGDSPGDGGFPWLVCGLSETTRRQWVTRFESQDLRLERIYPVGFTSSAAIEPLSLDSTHAVLDLLDGIDCYAGYEGNQLRTLRWGAAPLSPRNPEALINLIGGDRLDNLWISGRSEIATPVAKAISEGLNIPVRPFPRSEAKSNDAPPLSGLRSDGMIGSLRHTIGQSQRSVPWAEGAGPGPPWFKQASKWWIIVGTLFFLFASGSEISLAIRKKSTQWQIDQINSQVEQVRGEIAKVEGQSKEALQLLKQVDASREKLDAAATALQLVKTGITLRQEYAVNLLFTLAGSVTPSLAVNEFQEDEEHLIHLKAWAISEKESQEFVRAIVRGMGQWGLSVDRQEVKFGQGRMGLDGYDIELRLRPNPKYVEKS